MCDDCIGLTALEAAKLYASRGKFNRHTDPVTAPHAKRSLIGRYRAELAAGLYIEAGFTAVQVLAIEELVAAAEDGLGPTISGAFALKYLPQAQALHREGKLKISPMLKASPPSMVGRLWNAATLAYIYVRWLRRADFSSSPPKLLPPTVNERFEFWATVIRLLYGFPVKSEAEHRADVTARIAEEAAAAKAPALPPEIAGLQHNPGRLIENNGTEAPAPQHPLAHA